MLALAVAIVALGGSAAPTTEAPRFSCAADADIVACTRAWRQRVDQRALDFQPELAALESELDGVAEAARGSERRWVEHARAWLRFRQGRYGDAAEILEGLTGPGHHTLAIDPIFHADLGDAYAELGRTAAAQGQWRLALAAADEAQASGWRAEDTEAALQRSISANGAVRQVPDAGTWTGVKLVDLSTIRREGDEATYASIFFEPRDRQDGSAYWTMRHTVNCADGLSRLDEAHYFNAAGEPTTNGTGTRWTPPSNALARHVLKMVCTTPLGGGAWTPPVEPQAFLAAYRQQRDLPIARSPGEETLPKAVYCLGAMELMIEESAATGHVAGPSWFIRDWWSERAQLSDDGAQRALTAVRAAKARDAGAHDTALGACVDEAIAAGAVPGM
ncbi:hypothetical protein Q0812_12860 [Brevundimonas sp. 2R-24]|uniref:DUF1311 domain-containing protein n=1 Tax=Peiella sedimenti TaxID=3061083 RepID=A0ABT8SP12_9CAUL|nr:hypothetical protein [Caulobacteraceae bacterium XZ-24]